jgi:hypothetical protein
MIQHSAANARVLMFRRNKYLPQYVGISRYREKACQLFAAVCKYNFPSFVEQSMGKAICRNGLIGLTGCKPAAISELPNLTCEIGVKALQPDGHPTGLRALSA